MPFAGILEIDEPFLRGASQHPKEALFQIGSSILNMVTSYHRISGDHLTDHLIYLSLSSSFWFSLNSSWEHDFHLCCTVALPPPPLTLPPLKRRRQSAADIALSRCCHHSLRAAAIALSQAPCRRQAAAGIAL
jgi:hypothetical protein